MSQSEEDEPNPPPELKEEKPPNSEEEKKTVTFKERVRKEGLTLLVVLFTSVCFDLSANLFSPDAGRKLREFNERVVESTKNIGPLDMSRAFEERRSSNRYGWRLFSFKEPFNVTAAQNRLYVKWSLGQISSEEYERQKANIDWYALAPVSAVSRNKDGSIQYDSGYNSKKALSTVFGIPDGLIHGFRLAFSKGWASFLSYSAAFLLALVIVLASGKVTNPLAVVLASVLLASIIAYLILLPIMWLAKLALWFLNMPQTIVLMSVLSYPVVSIAGQLSGKVGEHYFQERLMKLFRRDK